MARSKKFSLSSSNWKDLPEDLVDFVLDRFDTFVSDQIRFGAVNKRWSPFHSQSLQEEQPQHAQQPPASLAAGDASTRLFPRRGKEVCTTSSPMKSFPILGFASLLTAPTLWIILIAGCFYGTIIRGWVLTHFPKPSFNFLHLYVLNVVQNFGRIILSGDPSLGSSSSPSSLEVLAVSPGLRLVALAHLKSNGGVVLDLFWRKYPTFISMMLYFTRVAHLVPLRGVKSSLWICWAVTLRKLERQQSWRVPIIYNGFLLKLPMILWSDS